MLHISGNKPSGYVVFVHFSNATDEPTSTDIFLRKFCLEEEINGETVQRFRDVCFPFFRIATNKPYFVSKYL